MKLTETILAREGLVQTKVAPVYVDGYVAIAATVADGIEAAITAATQSGTTRGRVEGRTDTTYTVARSVSVSRALVELRGISLTSSGNFPCLSVAAADVSIEKMTLSRPTTAGDTDSLSTRSCVTVNALRFRSRDCVYVNANHACLYFTHGACAGARVTGGKMSNSSARQNACLVYAAAGSTGNSDIVIDNVEVAGTGCPDGVLLFDAGSSAVRNCRVHDLAVLPTVTLTGWALVSGSVYRQRTATGTQTTDRADGNTRTVKQAGTQLLEDVTTPTTPAASKWGISGGYVYINLSGVDPSTQVITSDIVGGYGVTFYGSVSSYTGSFTMSDNLVESNQIRDVDGFGIYMQLALASATGNATKLNRLRNVCRVGVQNNSLPFAGIGWTGGTDCQMVGDYVNTVGTVSFPAPGVRMLPGGASTVCSGTATGVVVRGATTSGWHLSSTDWALDACEGSGNTQHGFTCFTGSSGDSFLRNTLSNCKASGNTLSGVNVAASVASTKASVTVFGGAFNSNAQRGIVVGSGGQDCKILGVECSENGSTSFAQIELAGTATRCVVDQATVTSLINATRGVLVANTVVDCVIGTITSGLAATPTYVLSLGAGLWVRQAGTVGFGATYLGSGTPEAVLTAAVGCEARRLDGGAGTTRYFKESGTGNTGWIAK